MALSANMLFTTQKPAFDMNVMLVKIASVITLIFFAMIFFICVKTLIKGREGLLAGPKGVYDNSSPLAFGFIPWSDISHMCIRKIEKIDFLLIYLKDVEKYKNSENEFLSKIIEMNTKLYETPVAINSKHLKCDIYELEKTLKNMHEKYQKEVQ
jgi:hypothetical protein